MKNRKIEKIIQRFEVGINAAKDKAILSKVLEAQSDIKEKGSAPRGSNIWRIIIKSPVTKLAAAAVVLVGLLIFFVYSTDGQNSQNNEGVPIEAPGFERQIAKDLILAEQFFENKDIAGLSQLLASQFEGVQFQTAEYLGQIGDESVLEKLQQLATQWQGQEENVFEEAISAIRERLDESEAPSETEQEPLETTVIQQQDEPRETMEIQTNVSGTVIDKNTYKPIHGALVGFRPNEGVFTDNEGGFRLTSVSYRKELIIYCSASGYASDRIAFQANSENLQNVIFKLDSATKLAGVVLNPNKQPLQGAEVRISGSYLPFESVITGSEGKYEIDGLNPLESSYSLLVKHPAYPASQYRIQPAPAGETLYKEIILENGVTIFGRVTNSQSEPVSGVTIGNTRSRVMWDVIICQTDEEGRYLLDNVDIGGLVLWAIHDQYAPFVVNTTVDSSQTQQQIDICLNDPHPLQGRVVDSEGEPVSGASIGIYVYENVRNISENRYPSDSQGRFVIPNAPSEGDLILSVSGEGFVFTRYTVDFSQQEHLITINRTGMIYGKVTDAVTSNPIQKFSVNINPTGEGSISGSQATLFIEGYLFNSPEGFFDSGDVRLALNGEYRVTVSADGYDPAIIEPVILQPFSDNPVRNEFILQPASIYAGRIIDEDSLPVAGATVVFFSDDNVINRQNWLSTTTDDNGIFTASGLAPNQNSIFVGAEGFASVEYHITDLVQEDEQFPDIVLNRGATIFGRITDENGIGIANATVMAFPSFGSAGRSIRPIPGPGPSHESVAQTDDEGYYYLYGVPVGRIQVSVISVQDRYIAGSDVNIELGELMEVNLSD